MRATHREVHLKRIYSEHKAPQRCLAQIISAFPIPSITRAGARVTKLPATLPKPTLSILPSHCRSAPATTSNQETGHVSCGSWMTLMKEGKMGRYLAHTFTYRADAPESMAFDGYQLKPNMASFIFLEHIPT